MPITPVKREGLKKHDPEKPFKNLNKVARALLESLISNDTEAFIEILQAFIRVNKSHLAQKAQIARSTVQLVFSKKGNPTLRTLAKIVHEAVA